MEPKEDFRERTFRTVKRGLGRLWRRRSVTITEYDPSYKVTYLGNVLTGWAKGEACVDKPLCTLWRNFQTTSKPDTHMKITVTQSGLKAVTKEHGLTEYWSHRITFCIAPTSLPKVFCWVYRHEGRKLKPELRCHAVLCSKESIARRMASELQQRLVQALIEFKRDKISRQNARLSLANSVYDNPSLPRRKILLSTGTHNYKPPLERSKSAPKLMAIEENLEEEDVQATSNKCDRLPPLLPFTKTQSKISRPDKILKRHSSESRFGSSKLGGLLQINLNKGNCSNNNNSTVNNCISSQVSNSCTTNRRINISSENLIKNSSVSRECEEQDPKPLERIIEEKNEAEAINRVDDNPFGSDEHIPIPVEEFTDFDDGSTTDEGESEEDFNKRIDKIKNWNMLLLQESSISESSSDVPFTSLDYENDESDLTEEFDQRTGGQDVLISSELNYVNKYDPSDSKVECWNDVLIGTDFESISSDINSLSSNQNTLTPSVCSDETEEKDAFSENLSITINANFEESPEVKESICGSHCDNEVISKEVKLTIDSCAEYNQDLINYQDATLKPVIMEENPPSYEEAMKNQHNSDCSSTKYNSLVRDRKRMFEKDKAQIEDSQKQSQRNAVPKRERKASGETGSFFINDRRKIFEQVAENSFRDKFFVNMKRKIVHTSKESENSSLKTSGKHDMNPVVDPFSTDEDSTPSLQSISSGNSDSSAPLHNLKTNEPNCEPSSIGYDLHSISSSEDSDESGFVESLTADDPLNRNDDKSRDLPHHQLMKSCILTSKTRCVEV